MKRYILLITLTFSLYAAPALKQELNFIQNDGTEFKGELKGDEWFNWIKDKKNHIIVYNQKSKDYELGMIKTVDGEEDLIPSGVSATSPISTYSEIDEKTLHEIWKKKREKAFSLMHR